MQGRKIARLIKTNCYKNPISPLVEHNTIFSAALKLNFHISAWVVLHLAPRAIRTGKNPFSSSTAQYELEIRTRQLTELPTVRKFLFGKQVERTRRTGSSEYLNSWGIVTRGVSAGVRTPVSSDSSLPTANFLRYQGLTSSSSTLEFYNKHGEIYYLLFVE